MSAPTELSFDEILKFMLAHNGKVTNHELVKHFKVFLTNPDMRDHARTTFKKHVNTLAIIKNHDNEKWLILKKKYVPNNGKERCDASADKPTDSPQVLKGETSVEYVTVDHDNEPIPERPPLPLQLNQDLALLTTIIQGYSAPPLEELPSDTKENNSPDNDAPKVYPRRRSSADKIVHIEKRSSASPSGSRLSITTEDNFSADTLLTLKSEMMLVDSEQKISVKERKQMFNRLASEGDILKPHLAGNLNAQGCDEEDRASVVSLDPKVENEPLDSKQKAWILCASRPGEYHTMAKMCSENPKLAKLKTAMHWACKRGDENLVKMLAGIARSTVNERTNGGYTPLHLAMQFRRKNLYELLVNCYGADPNLSDWSGRKPNQWIDACKSPIECRKKESFLRMGSLNVKVKKTTEAFSNFLGVGATRNSSYLPKSVRDVERRTSDDIDHIHKNWGSADSIPKDDKLMPPPMSSKVRRRGHNSRRVQTPQTRSTPSTPDQPRLRIGSSDNGDSDSDSAAGFHSAWRQRASNVI